MSFLAPLAPAVGGLIGGLFGGANSPAPQVNYKPPGFNAGGLNATFSKDQYTVNPSASRTGLVNSLAGTFGQQAGALGQLGQQFAPGYSALRAAQLGQISSNRQSAISNLQQNLQNRRVYGSSFAQDAVNRTAAQYDQEQANTIAQTYLQELQASQNIIQQQYTAARGQFQTGLDEMNLEANLASQLTQKASSTLESAASTQAQLDAKAAQGTGSFFGNIGTQFGSGIGNMLGGAGGLGGLFGGGAGMLGSGGFGSGLAFSGAGAGIDGAVDAASIFLL